MWFITHQTAAFFGPVSRLAGGGTPCPATRVAEPLRFRQIIFAPAQRLFGAPAFGHIHHHTNEFTDITGRAENRMTCSIHVFRRTVWKNDSEMRIKIFPRGGCGLELAQGNGSIFRMNARYEFVE